MHYDSLCQQKNCPSKNLIRGCLDAAQKLMRDHGIGCNLRDERFIGKSIDAKFIGTLRHHQEAAVVAILRYDTGVLLVTGKPVGEGFDHPPLDTMVLAMPVSWKGTLQQYAGRLHREFARKTAVRIINFVDTGHPALLRMWDKRQRGYRAMGYRIRTTEVLEEQQLTALL